MVKEKLGMLYTNKHRRKVIFMEFTKVKFLRGVKMKVSKTMVNSLSINLFTLFVAAI